MSGEIKIHISDLRKQVDFDHPSSIEEKAKEEQLKELQLANRHTEKLIDWKGENICKVFWLCTACLFCLFLILIFDGFKPWGFHLSDGVIIAIISGVTVNVLGLFIIVLNNIFPIERNNKLH